MKAYRTRTGAQRYNNRIERIWETARRIERERLARGEAPNPNLTSVVAEEDAGPHTSDCPVHVGERCTCASGKLYRGATR